MSRFYRLCRALHQAFVLLLTLLLCFNVGMVCARYLAGSEVPALAGCAYIAAEGEENALVRPGDFVLLRKKASYAPGEALCYKDSDSYLYARVARLENGAESPLYYFEGVGASEKRTVSAGIPLGEIAGAIVGRVPRLGGWLRWLQTVPGLLATVAAGVLLELPFGPRRPPEPAPEPESEPEKGF